MSRGKYHYLLAACVVVVFTARAADVLQLKSGASLDGQVIDSENGAYLINTGRKEVSVKQVEVKEAKIDVEARAEFTRRRDALKAEDAEGHYQLAQWLQTQHFYGFAKEEFEAAIAIQPMHEKARAALGFTYKDGQWAGGEVTAASSAPPAAQTQSARKQDSGYEGAPNSAQASGESPAEAAVKKFWMERAAYYKEVTDACKTLAPGSAAIDKDKQAAFAVLKKDSSHATEAVLAALDCRNNEEPPVRLGALKALEHMKSTHPSVSAYLSMEAVADPDADVRKATVELIKTRGDNPAIGGMMRYLMADFDGAGKVIDAGVRDNAVEALRGLNENKRIYEALLGYVTVEARTANVSLSNLATRQINTFQNVNNLIIPLSLPIQLPELKIEGVKTTVICPAVFALREITGQDFGNDADRWARWIRKQ